MSLLLPVLILIGGELQAQELRVYHITCDSAEFAYINNNPLEQEYIDCIFEYEDQVWDDARIRLRGESSIEYPKKSYKVNFDGDKPFLERDKINLISEYTDPSYCREYFSYDFYQRAGLYSSDTWFARLYVNGNYMGLYLDVEQIDEHFLERTGLPDDASVYKADAYGSLLTPGDTVEVLWEKETNTDTDYYDLNNLIEWLATTPDESFFGDLITRFNASELARVIALNALAGNQSTYYHNYFMVHDLDEGGLWHMLPWDMDRSFYYWSSYENPQYFRSGHQYLSDLNPLVRRCWRNPSMRSLIFNQFGSLIDSIFVPDYYETKVDALIELLYDAVEEDTLKQFTIEDFVTTLENVPNSVQQRGASISNRIEYDPLPFDVQDHLITPAGVYFSWESTYAQDGSDITYEIRIGDDKLFSGEVTTIPEITGTSLILNDFEAGKYYWNVYAHASNGGETRSLTFYKTFTVDEGAFNGTTITTPISAPQSWTADGSPYHLPAGLIIEAGVTLQIEPGVLIGIGGGESIQVFGGLQAAGSESDSIHFVPLDPAERWGALVFNTPSTDATLSYVSLTRGSDNPAGPVPGGMIQILEGDLTILDSHITDGSSAAIHADHSDLRLERVNIEHFPGCLIQADNNDFIVRDCRFSFGAYGDDNEDLIDIEDMNSDFYITGCQFFDGNDDAINADDIEGGEISRNVIRDAGDKGIAVSGTSQSTFIANNLITGCDEGISFQEDASGVLYNNVIAFCDKGITLKDGLNGAEIVVRNLVLWENDEAISLKAPYTLDVQYSLIQGEPLYNGEGNINIDPEFIDQWNLNFYLEGDSPLIDAGYGSGHPEFDFDFIPRMDDSLVLNTGAGEIDFVDIGAFEYNPGYTPIPPTPSPPVAASWLLQQNYPNPFNATTTIPFNIVSGNWADIDIYDISGRVVYSRKFRDLQPGQKVMAWSGRNQSGRQLASGLYFCRIVQESGQQTRKMILLK